MSLRIAIATATPHHQTETFVKAHIARLDKVVLVLTGGSLPEADGEGRWLLGTSKPALVASLAKRVILGQDRREQLRRRITKLLRQHKVDLVVAEYGVTAMEMLPCCEAAGIPLVAYFLGFDAFDKGVLARTGNYARLFSSPSYAIAVSEAMRKHLVGLGANSERVGLIACGVDVKNTVLGDPQNAPPTFIAAGRFAHTKAPNLLLAAFKKVMQARPQARLLMIGDGPLWESCAHYVKAERMQAHVELAGRMDHKTMGERMSKARAFVQHSMVALNGDAEGMPVAVLEALSAGVPVIATRHMGIAEAVQHGVSGLLCEEGDIDRMAAHMIELVDDPARAAAMGQVGRAHVREHFDMDMLLGRLQHFLEEAARR